MPSAPKQLEKIQDKVTIVVVHGTFASPRDRGTVAQSPESTEWYRPGGSFCTQLDGYLAELGSSVRTWNHLGDGRQQFFWWSGDNSWQARSAAADRLAAYLRKLGARGWTCHLIAHSHGGNIVIDAIKKLGWMEGVGTRAMGDVYLLGTPIYTLPSPGRSRRRMALYALSVIALIAVVILHDLTFEASLIGITVRASVLYWFCGVGFLILLLRYVAPFFTNLWDEILTSGAGLVPGGFPNFITPRFFFAMNSSSDEAFLLLQGIVNAKRPLPPMSLKLLRTAKDAATLARQFDRHLFGAEDSVSRASGLITLAVVGAVAIIASSSYLAPGVWLAVLLASYAVLGCASPASTLRGIAVPVRLVIGCCTWLTGTVRAVVSVVFYNRMWETVRGSVLGTSGAPFPTEGLALSRGEQEKPLIGVRPLFYEELADAVVARVRAGRDRGVAESVQRVLSSVEAPEALADAVEALMETATNVTLVHAAYYTDPTVIKLLAQWIADPPRERLGRKGFTFRDPPSDGR